MLVKYSNWVQETRKLQKLQNRKCPKSPRQVGKKCGGHAHKESRRGGRQREEAIRFGAASCNSQRGQKLLFLLCLRAGYVLCV